MHAERLTTRISIEGFQGEACLLIYDAQHLNSTMFGDDVRELLDARPGVAFIYLLAPFVSKQEVRQLLLDGVMLMRLSSYFHAIGGRVSILSFFETKDRKVSCEIPFSISESGKPIERETIELNPELRHGWLFDLFDRCRGRVDAPSGVHFAKSSRRHSVKFLRASNVLLSSAACAAVGYFTLGALCCSQIKRIFVDTAPLLSVAFAIQKIAIVHQIWDLNAPMNSFSSYGGISRLPSSSGRDLILVSASTSGGLVRELTALEFNPHYIATLFYLGEYDDSQDTGVIICDLTFRQGRSFGYSPIVSYPSVNCPLCNKGYFLAELEGDQFQLERRATKQLHIRGPVQTQDARETLDLIARNDLIGVATLSNPGETSNFIINPEMLLRNVDRVRERVIRALRRYVPLPLSHVVLVNISEQAARALFEEAKLTSALENVRFLTKGELSTCSPAETGTGGALVIFGTLSNFATARDINAQLRIVCPRGCVSYISLVTIANSAEHLADLKMFLTYGELGIETFTYSAAYSLMLPPIQVGMTAWEAEEQMLAQLRDNSKVPSEIENRINILRGTNIRIANLFWPGRHGELAIRNDFVYLTVDNTRRPISQADVSATVANLLCSARVDYRGLKSNAQNGHEPIHWHQSVYGHVVLHPAAFENFNDAILQSAFLRFATPAELNYSSDANASDRIAAIIRAAINSWVNGGGDCLSEFLVALATQRLSLYTHHTQEIKSQVQAATHLPSYIYLISNAIRTG